MRKIFYEDAYCLGLLYAYIYGGKRMMLMDDLKKFHDAIEQNLTEDGVFDMYATIWHDDEPSIYYSSEGKHGEIYYVLYPDFDLARAKSKYIGCISTKALIASQEDNALKCLDLKKVNGNITRREMHIYIGISESNTFMKQFMEKLKNGEIKIEVCPQENDSELTEESIIYQLEEYHKILDTGIIDKVTKEEQGLVKKLKPNRK